MSYQLNEFQERWLQALESGEYKQTREALSDGEGFCCLGVACVLDGMVAITREDSLKLWFDEEYDVAPHRIVEKLKLRGKAGIIDGAFDRDGHPKTLAGMNDDGKKFKTIAKFIRANPEKVFMP